MSHRTQVILTDELYSTLRNEADRTGLRLGELVRRALAKVYGRQRASSEALVASFGAWKDRDFDGESYVEQLRTGMEKRLNR
ncbi:MAG: hypothetical protein ACREP9_16790 [Candidatus Dormibacteraceae bacterium]